MERAGPPRFASFKPKAKTTNSSATQEPEQSPSHHEHGRRARSSARKNRERETNDGVSSRSHRTDHDRKQHLSHRSGSNDEAARRHRSPTAKASAHADELEESDIFIIDRRGDSKNTQYGSLHRYSIPEYRRIGSGNLIGAPLSSKIDRENSTDKQLCLMSDRNKVNSARAPRLLASRAAQPKESRLRFVQPAWLDPAEVENDYIHLSRPSRKRKRDSESPDPLQDYRSIEGKAKPRPDDDDTFSASGSDSEPRPSATIDESGLAARQKNAQLSKHTKANPHSLEAWLELAEHQAELVNPGLSVSSLTGTERRALSDLRLAIFNDASTHITKGKPDRDRLLLAIIQEGRLVWDSSKLASKWTEILEENPTSILLWTEHLNYVQDTHTFFRYDTCKEAFLRCLRILSEAHSLQNAGQRKATEELSVYVTIRLTCFLRDCGYDELSFATWQALHEYHYNMPADLQHSSIEERLNALEQFWDSEAPRFGEENAKGWARHMEAGSNVERHPAILVNPGSSRNILLAFADQEGQYHGRVVLSSSAEDEDAITDPFRYVMFSDLREVLECLGGLMSKHLLVAGLCTFLGLPLPATDGTRAQREWSRDVHIARAGIICYPDENFESAFDTRIRSQHETATTLFGGAFNRFKQNCDKRETQEDARFVDRCLTTLVNADRENEALVEYLVAFKAGLFPEEAAKTAKRLLKDRSSSLRLYNSYALVLAHSGQLAKALEVWTTALKMRSNLPAGAQDEAIVLWHSRHTMLIQSQDSDALEILLSITEGSNQLRTTRVLENGFDAMQLAGKFGLAAAYADLLAWLAYMAKGHDIEAALTIYKKYADILSSSTGHHGLEILHQYQASLIGVHIDRRKAYKPTRLRSAVDESLELFPSNSVILGTQASIASEDRLRTLIKNKGHRNVAQLGLIETSYQLTAELARADRGTSGSTANNIRAGFTRALVSADSVVSHSPTLWTMWLRWEYSSAMAAQGNKISQGLQQARQVLFDGLRFIPFCKHFAVIGIKLFCGTGVVGEQELRQCYEVLVERGIRIRFELHDQ